MAQGKITPNGVVLETHENATVVYFTQLGFDIELIPPSQLKGTRTPDIRMNGFEWEVKAPTGNSSNTIKRAFKTAIRQSENIIFDLRSSQLTDEVNITRLEKEFEDIKRAKRLLIITKTQGLIEKSKQK